MRPQGSVSFLTQRSVSPAVAPIHGSLIQLSAQVSRLKDGGNVGCAKQLIV